VQSEQSGQSAAGDVPAPQSGRSGQSGPSSQSGRSGPWGGLIADSRHGPLPAVLLALTVVTGLVDAVSILSLGRVFVANMTGNVVFIGFALAGAPGFSLSASLAALAGFLTGALVAGAVIQRRHGHRGALLRFSASAELAFLLVALIVCALAGSARGDLTNDVIAASAAVAMGVQNAVVRRLAVPDLTTTVLTMTLTGIAADVLGGRGGPVLFRRVLAVLTMLSGAIAGALLVLHVGTDWALGAAVAVLALVAFVAFRSTRRPAAWQEAS
jgi:uncharacterized membrane protein YoaK (UPF0700 family)